MAGKGFKVMAFSGMGLCMGRFLYGKVLARLVVRISQSVQRVGVAGHFGWRRGG